MLQTNKTVLITGAGRRLGQFMAESFAKNGWLVIAHYHTSEPQQLLANFPDNIIAIQADLRQQPQVENLVKNVVEQHGKIDLLINNASIFEYDTLKTLSYQSMVDNYLVHMVAPALLAKQFCDAGINKAVAKQIISMLDHKFLRLNPYFASYTLSKSALHNFTTIAAMEYAPDVRVNALALGPTLKGVRQRDEHFQQQQSNTPLARGASPQDVMTTVEYLLSTQSITGVTIPVDGGAFLPYHENGDPYLAEPEMQSL